MENNSIKIPRYYRLFESTYLRIDFKHENKYFGERVRLGSSYRGIDETTIGEGYEIELDYKYMAPITKDEYDEAREKAFSILSRVGERMNPPPEPQQKKTWWHKLADAMLTDKEVCQDPNGIVEK